MYKVARELIDRFIEWLLSRTSGETLEERLMAALKALSILSGTFLWIIFMLLVIDINMKIRLNDTEVAAVMVRKLFDPTNNPLDEFIQINKNLTERLNSSRDQNILLIRDNLRLVRENQLLTQENGLLKEEVLARDSPKPAKAVHKPK